MRLIEQYDALQAELIELYYFQACTEERIDILSKKRDEMKIKVEFVNHLEVV
jgi:hypothetical protein